MSRSVSRLLAVALLVTAWMTSLAVPIVAFLRGGSYTHEDAVATARYFAIFAVSLALWSAQGIYARAFYAAQNTLTPAISGTIVTIVSIPLYALLFHRSGVTGLAIASDLGILAHTLALAVLLHRYRLVRLGSLEYGELARALFASVLAFAFAGLAVRFTPHPAGHGGDTLLMLAGTLVWAAVCVLTLRVTGSKLMEQILRRKQA